MDNPRPGATFISRAVCSARPHKGKSRNSGQNTPDSGSRKRDLVGGEKGLLEDFVVRPSCTWQNAKAPIIERDTVGLELAEIYDTRDGANDCYREQPGQTTRRVVHTGSGTR
jgi:hypothetical protein